MHRIAKLMLLLAVCQVSQGIDLLTNQQTFDAFDSMLKVPIDVIEQSSVIYSNDEIMSIQHILIDSAHNQLIIGARDAIVRLNATSLQPLQTMKWLAPQHDKDMCHMKGQNQTVCHNFVRTLATVENQLLVCGTYAYQPKCAVVDPVNLPTTISETMSGIGATPYSPSYPHAFFATDKQVYTGLATDFGGFDSSLLRFYPTNQLLHTSQSKWLNAAEFVTMFELNNFVYMVFREEPLEKKLHGHQCQKRVSRIGRVCLNDQGGSMESFTTFTKASMSCKKNGEVFDHVVDARVTDDGAYLAAIFVQSHSNLSTSALCIYSISDLTSKVFAGSFLTSDSGYTSTFPNNSPFFSCEVQPSGETVRAMHEVQNLQLHSTEFTPISEYTVAVGNLESYARLSLLQSPVKHQVENVMVAFVATKQGIVKKFTFNGRSGRKEDSLCLTEVMQFSREPELQIRDMKIHQARLLIAVNDRVIGLSLANCDRHSGRSECIQSRDPLCAWHTDIESCISTSGQITDSMYQQVDTCPRLADRDAWHAGPMSQWSAWTKCTQKDAENGDDEMSDADLPCRCRMKMHRGQMISQVTNCTRNGAWTDWSIWSPCTATCGKSSLKHRVRACTNPSPAFGGTECHGDNEEKMSCGMDECPPPKMPEIDGQWSVWSSWTRCSRDCGGGSQSRSRRCNNPAPANGGYHCIGCDTETTHCNTQPCQEIRRWTDWTAWQIANSTSGQSASTGGVVLKRYKFACKAHIHDPMLLSVGAPRVEEKYCSNDNKDCQEAGFASRDGAWSTWSEWTPCSEPCGTRGVQTRLRSCSEPSPLGSGSDCAGAASEQRSCNSYACAADWSCWSSWGACSQSCGDGHRSRDRHCPQKQGQTPCDGDRRETEACNSAKCADLDGYADWSSWSLCSVLGVRVRVRECVNPLKCSTEQPDVQIARCDEAETAGSIALDVNTSSMSQMILIAAVVGAFLLGITVAVLVACWAVHTHSNCCFPMSKWPSESLAQSISTTTTNQGSVTRIQPPGVHVHHSNKQHPKLSNSRHNLSPVIPGGTNLYTCTPTRTSLNSAGILDTGLNQPHIHNNPLDELLANKMSFDDDDMPNSAHGSSDYTSGPSLDGNSTLKRHIRASMNPRDFL